MFTSFVMAEAELSGGSYSQTQWVQRSKVHYSQVET